MSPILPHPLPVPPFRKEGAWRTGADSQGNPSATWAGFLWEFCAFSPFLFTEAVDLAALKNWEWRGAGQDKPAWKGPLLFPSGPQGEPRAANGKGGVRAIPCVPGGWILLLSRVLSSGWLILAWERHFFPPFSSGIRFFLPVPQSPLLQLPTLLFPRLE